MDEEDFKRFERIEDEDEFDAEVDGLELDD